MENLEELKRKYEELGKEIERLEKKKTGRWRAESGEHYYCFNELGDVTNDHDDNLYADNFRYKTRNYFKTEEEAQEYLEKINTYWELADLAEELNGGEEIDWENLNQAKYEIMYDFYSDALTMDTNYGYKKVGQIYYLNENFLDIAKERIGEERLKKLFKE